MSEKPKVSIIVPIYNAEKHLKQCLDSVVNQILKDIEIILINDGSTDSSLSIMKEYSAADKRIKIIDKKNTGYGNSMNVGMDSASGEYIGIVESDDYAELNMFDLMYNLAKKDNLDVVRSEFYYYISDTGNRKSEQNYVPHNTVIKPSEEWSIFYQQPSVWANIYRTEFIRKNGIRFLETPGASYQDTAFSFKVYSLADRFEMVYDAFIHYRIDGNSSSFQSNNNVFCVCDEYDEIVRFTKENGTYRRYAELIAHLRYIACLWNYNRLADPYDKEFLVRWREDLKREKENGNLTKEMFFRFELDNIKRILLRGTLPKDVQDVSAIIYIRSAENLERCIDSILNQTLDDIEIICTGNTCGKDVQKILNKYSDRIVTAALENCNRSSSLNAALDMAKAKYVTFIDSDDWIAPELYESALKYAYDADIVVFGTDITEYPQINTDIIERYHNIGFIGKGKTGLNLDSSIWNKMYHRVILDEENLRFSDDGFLCDQIFYWKYAMLANKAFYQSEKRYSRHYVVGEKNCVTNPLEAFEKIIAFIDEYRIELDNDEINNRFLNCFWSVYVNASKQNRKKILERGTNIVIKLGLTGDAIVDCLKNREYEKITPSVSYSNCVKNIISYVLRRIRGDRPSMREMKAAVNEPEPFVKTKTVMGWHGFEENGWSKIYDSNSDDDILNWGYYGGIYGIGRMHVPKASLMTAGKYRITSVMHNSLSVIAEGEVSDNDIDWRIPVYDGCYIYVLCINIRKTGKVTLTCVNIDNGREISQYCRIIWIERKVQE